MKNNVKTNAKAAGVKGVVVNDNNVILTSFGKGNKAQVETKYAGTELVENKIVLSKTEIKNENHAEVTNKKNKNLTGTVLLPIKDNQIVMKNNLDFLEMKPKLENYFFGEKFEKSNIPVQIAYQILDIEKIMSSHINNIIYTMNNLMGFTGENEDIIGGITFSNSSITFEKFKDEKKIERDEDGNPKSLEDKLKLNFDNNKAFNYPRLAYLSNDFAMPKNSDETENINKNIYYAIHLLGFVRQALAHKDTSTIYNIASTKFEKDNANDSFNEAKCYLKNAYADGVAKLNCGVKNGNTRFSKGSFEILAKNNIYYLATALGIDFKDEDAINTLAQDYYDYIVRMTGKNIGFSIKKLREILIKKLHEILVNDKKDNLGKDRKGDEIDFTVKRYDTFRSKLYTLIDFTIFNYYKNTDKIDSLVNDLRQATTEKDKSDIYSDEVESWDDLLKPIKYFAELNGTSFADLEYKSHIQMLRDVLVNNCKNLIDLNLKTNANNRFLLNYYYSIIDTVIYRYYNKDQQEIDELNRKQQKKGNEKEKSKIQILIFKIKNEKDEEKKNKIYFDEVNNWSEDLLNQIKSAIEKENIGIERYFFEVPTIKEKISGELKETDADYFVALIYFLTKFIDAKEINDLLTNLINKFENIQSFIDLYEEINNKNLEFSNNAKMFEDNTKMFEDNAKMFEGTNCQYIANKLREVKCFARMETPNIEVRETMKADALAILGKDYNNEKEKEEIDKYLVKENPILKNGKKDRGVLNFIMNNVVSNKRFQYLVRYADANSVHALAKQTKLVKFVLSSMPDSQIDKYYEKVTDIKPTKNNGIINFADKNKWIAEILGKEEAPKKYQHTADKVKKADKLELLAKLISNFNFDKISDVQQDLKSIKYKDQKKKAEEKKLLYKNSISLYLTVLYILVKNLVNVNSRYFLAFHCVERDHFYGISKNNITYLKIFNIYNNKLKQNQDNNQIFKIYNKKLEQNQDNNNLTYEEDIYKKYRNIVEHLYKKYRNNVEHLNVVRNINGLLEDFKLEKHASYFAIYHYAMQCKLFKDDKNEYIYLQNNEEKIITGEDIFKQNSDHNTYSKLALGLLNLPFAYNKARYNALSYEKLFDMNQKEDSQK